MQDPRPQESVDARFGASINALRVRRGLSQRSLAAELTAVGMPVDASAISRIEAGTRSVRLTEAVVIASLLGVRLEGLLAGVSMPSALESAQRHLDDAETEMREAVSFYMSAQIELATAADVSDDSKHRALIDAKLTVTPITVAVHQLKALAAEHELEAGRSERLLKASWEQVAPNTGALPPGYVYGDHGWIEEGPEKR